MWQSASTELSRVRSMEIIVIVAQVFAVPLFLRENAIWIRVLIAAYCLICLIVFNVLYFYYEILDIIVNINNFNRIVQNLAISITHLGGTLKFLNILLRLRDINNLVEKARRLPSTYLSKEKHYEIIKMAELENKLIVVVYSSTVFFTCVAGAYTIITALLVWLGNQPKTIPKILEALTTLVFADYSRIGNYFPYRLHFPDILSNQVRLIYCCLGLFILGIQIVAVDSVNFLLVNQVRCHLKFLIVNLAELGPARSSELETCQVLEECIKYHQEILKLRNEIEDIFNAPILVQFLVSLFVVVLTGFQAIVFTADDGVVLIYFYSSGVMFQLFAYCWFTNQVMEQNKLVAYAGYDTSWFDFGDRFSKMLLIFMINAQKPLTFTAGGFFSLSLNSFTGMLSRSYSYIAVLRQVYA